ncbi:uncharacterized protein LOC121381362 [Gigantopelta aegis]|uniref:uncharacterized protein LOC121381362 n=1 Tax=Gigantopelta aegis TaxID=1735272 RepID=UPI001B88E4F9|nr:uncharacterized protein LOC121381362 [Gigantopelta aegis]
MTTTSMVTWKNGVPSGVNSITWKEKTGFPPDVNSDNPRHFIGLWKMSQMEVSPPSAKEVSPTSVKKVSLPPVKFRQINPIADWEQLNEEDDVSILTTDKQVEVPLGRNMRAEKLQKFQELQKQRKSHENHAQLEKKADTLINKLLKKGMSLSQIQEELSTADIPCDIIKLKMEKQGLAFSQ